MVVERVGHAYGGPGLRPFSWRSLAALSRITANVSKVTTRGRGPSAGSHPESTHPFCCVCRQELLLCYIIYPADLSDDELDSPECLSRLTVQVTQSLSDRPIVTADLTDLWPCIFSQQEVIVSRWVSSRERVEQDDV